MGRCPTTSYTEHYPKFKGPSTQCRMEQLQGSLHKTRRAVFPLHSTAFAQTNVSLRSRSSNSTICKLWSMLIKKNPRPLNCFFPYSNLVWVISILENLKCQIYMKGLRGRDRTMWVTPLKPVALSCWRRLKDHESQWLSRKKIKQTSGNAFTFWHNYFQSN